MSVGDEVVVTAHEVTAAEQQALVAQCTRCCLKDIAWWTVPAAVAGAVVGLLWGDGPRDVVGPVLVVSVLVLVHVVQVRRALRATFPVGLAVETVVAPHRLSTSTGSYALPQVTGLRTEGRVVRIDHGGDHSHLLPELVDVDLVRRRAGVPAPAPEPGPTVVVVPPGLGSRAAAGCWGGAGASRASPSCRCRGRPPRAAQATCSSYAAGGCRPSRSPTSSWTTSCAQSSWDGFSARDRA